MDVLEMPVTLIVKAPNQQIEDQTIQCELTWTIKKLKGYLSEVYPSKPRTEEQKVIYSGKLLHDNVILKDVLRQYEGQEAHTVHLVCTPPRDYLKCSFGMKRPSQVNVASQPVNQGDGTAQQNANSSSSSSSQGTPQAPVQSPEGSVGNSNNSGVRHRYPTVQEARGQFTMPDFRGFWMQTMRSYNEAAAGSVDPHYMAQQMALMQQAYAQYMSQYMQLMQSGAIPQGAFLQPPVGMQPPVPHPAEPIQRNAQEPVAPAVQPNNDGVLQEVEDEENRGNRDWIDWFYLMSRFIVLFSIVYFYSSVTRLMIVSLLGIMMYLYQVGFFRVQQVRRIQNAAPVPNGEEAANVGPQQEELREQPAVQEHQQPSPPDAPRDAPEEQEATATAATEDRPVDPPQPSMLALTWTFFTSFFASLIPEQPNAI